MQPANTYTLPQSLPNITAMDAAQMTTASDIQVSDSGEDGAHYTPAIIADTNSSLDANNSTIITALDNLTPLKVRLHFPQNLQFHPGTYQTWRQAILDSCIMHIQASTVLLSVREFLVKTQAHAAEQQWKHIQTREAAQRIMLGWLERDLTSLNELLDNYALGFTGFSQGPEFVDNDW